MAIANEVLDHQRKERHILAHLTEQRTATETETRQLREELGRLGTREAELREEVTMLDAILGTLPVPAKENEAPSLFAPAPRPAVPAPVEGVRRKRRRKGSRREQVLPAMRAKFGARTFDAGTVAGMIVEVEGGERRKAYFAAWSLVRDLTEDGVIEVVSEEGAGPRKRRTYRFVDRA